jgi:hypothetical protein
MVALLGGEDSELFASFVTLACEAFLSLRGTPSLMEAILSIVSAFADSDLPCFKYKEDVLVRLRERFLPGLPTRKVPPRLLSNLCSCLCLSLSHSCIPSFKAAEKFASLLRAAGKDWTTSAYDGIQKLQNNIYSDTWK